MSNAEATGPAREHRAPALNAAAAAAADVVGKLSTLAWTVVAARLLTQEQFGAFNLALALALIASALAEGGFDPILVRRASEDRRRLALYHTQALAWQVALAVPIFVLAAAAVWLTRPETDLRAAIVLVLLAIFLDIWSDTARSSAAAARDQTSTSRALALQRLATAALMIPAIVAGLGITGMAAAFLAGSAIGWVGHVRAVARLGVAFRPALLDRPGMRVFARGTWNLALSALLAIALFRLDAVLLAVLRGDAAVGEYAAAYRLFETVLFLTFAVVGAVAPLMFERAGDPAEVARLAELVLVVLGFVYVPFVVVCLADGRAVLELLYGTRYESAGAALRWLAPTPLAYALAAAVGAVLVARKRTVGILVGAAVALVLNVALNVALIPVLGVAGAALATTAAYVVEAAIGLAFALRLVPGLAIARPFAETLALGALMGAALVALPLPVVIEAPVTAAAYAAGWVAFVRARRPERLAAVRTLLLRGSGTP